MSRSTGPSRLGICLILAAGPLFSCGDGGSDACESDDDCGQGARCVPDGRCVDGAKCVSEAECVEQDARTDCNLETFTCDLREGFADECGADRPCPFGQFCSELLGRCLDSTTSRDCVRRSQCPANQICDRSANKCIENPGCFGEAFCEEGETCDLVNRICRTLTVECTSCFGTGTCEAEDETCSTATQECLAEQAEPICMPGEMCDPLGRCVQCTRSAECGPGLFCNTSIGRCESNVQCANDVSQCPDTEEVTCILCELPDICDPRTRRCQPPPTPCENDTDCIEDEFCDRTLELPVCVPRVPDCFDDALDDPPNGAAASARILEIDGGPVYDELKLCPGDEDWYRIDVEAGTYLTVDARFEHDLGDLEMQLFLSDGRTLIDESRTITDNERVELEVGTDLTVLVRVFFAAPTVRDLPYRLVATRDAGSVCPDDPNEPNDGPSEARTITSTQTVEARLCPADPDWFVLRDVEPASRISLSLTFVDNLGDLDLEVFRPGAAQPFLRAASTDDDEALAFDAPYGGDFLIRVTAKAADTNVYSLRATVAPGGGACLDDPFESNDTIATASSTGAVQLRDLFGTMCQGDDDWYSLPLESGQAFIAQLGTAPGADLELKLYPPDTADENATPFAASTGIIPRESIGTVVTETGDFLLRVQAFDDQQIAPYQLNWRSFALGTCGPDALDDQGRGATNQDPFVLPIPPFSRNDLQLCTTEGDEDWYQISVPAGFISVVRLAHVPSQAFLDLELWDLNGNLRVDTLAQAPGDVRELRIVGNGPPGSSALFLLHPIVTLGPGGPYALSQDVIPVFVCLDDDEEPNDDFAGASLAAAGAVPVTLNDLTLCGSDRAGATSGDEDWFVVNPPAAGAQINAEIAFERGDLFLELRSPGGSVRACVNGVSGRCFSDGNGLSEQVTFTATVAAPYILRVGSIYGSPASGPPRPQTDTPYTLRVEHTVP